MSSIKSAVVIDSWKYPIFHEKLTEAGYRFAAIPDAGLKITVLKVPTTDLVALAAVVKAANDEAARVGPPKETH